MHVKGFTKLHPLVPEDDRGTFAGLAHPNVPAYLRSLGITSAELLPDPRLRRRQLPRRKRAAQLLGLQLASASSRRSRATCSRRSANEFKEMVNQFHAAWHRGDPRRGLQPHRRRQRTRADAVVQGHRQRQLLPADAGPEALLHQRHRHRKHGQPVASSACCRWSPTRCATGRRKCRSTGSASISRPSSRASPTGSTKAAAFSMPAGRIRCSPASS